MFRYENFWKDRRHKRTRTVIHLATQTQTSSQAKDNLDNQHERCQIRVYCHWSSSKRYWSGRMVQFFRVIPNSSSRPGLAIFNEIHFSRIEILTLLKPVTSLRLVTVPLMLANTRSKPDASPTNQKSSIKSGFITIMSKIGTLPIA